MASTKNTAVLWSVAQNLEPGEQSQARTNIGLGSAAVKDVPTSGDATTTQVVMGDDTRLTDSRNPLSHTHGYIQNGGTFSTESGASATIATNDALLIVDDTDKKIKKALTFNTTASNTYLSKTGSWTSLPVTSAGTDLKLSSGTISVDTDGTASGTQAFVMGNGTSAAGKYSFAGGYGSSVTDSGTQGEYKNGEGTFVWGQSNSASGNYAAVFGGANAVSTPVAFVSGQRNTISCGTAGVIALGQDLKLSTGDVSMVFGRWNADNHLMGGITGEYATLARITGWGSDANNRKNIEWLSDAGLLETAIGFQTRCRDTYKDQTSGVVDIGSRSEIKIKSDYAITQYGKSTHYPTIELLDSAYKSSNGSLDDSVNHTATLTATDLLLHYTHKTGPGDPGDSEYTKYSSHYIEFTSSVNGAAHFSLGPLAVPALSPSTASGSNSIRLRLGTGFDSKTELTNLVLNTISVRTIWAGDLNQANPLCPSEQAGEITIITGQKEGSASTITNFWYRDASHPNGDQLSDYIKSGTACMLITVQPSTGLGTASPSFGWFQKIS